MNGQLTSGKIKRSIQRFSDYARDLLQADMNTLADRLNMFFDFCKSDDVFSEIHQQLLTVPGVSFDQWYSEMQANGRFQGGSGQLIFPTEPEARMALMYQLLLGLREGKVDFRELSINHFVIGSSRYDDYIRAINETVTQPLVRELAYRLEEMEEKLPEEKTASVAPSVVQIIHHATHVIQQNATGNNITQQAKIVANPEVARLFEQLRGEVQSSELNSVQQTEALDVIEEAEQQSNAPKPKVSIIRALLASLPDIGSIVTTVSTIISAVSQST